MFWVRQARSGIGRTRFEMQILDPVLSRSLEHAYDIDTLPVVS